MFIERSNDKTAMEGTSIMPLSAIAATNASPVIGFVGNEILSARPVRRNLEQPDGFYAHVFQRLRRRFFVEGMRWLPLGLRYRGKVAAIDNIDIGHRTALYSGAVAPVEGQLHCGCIVVTAHRVRGSASDRLSIVEVDKR
jgi:hypothetical protein